MTRPHLHAVKSTGRIPSAADPCPESDSGFVMIVDDRGTARNLLVGLARSLEPDLLVESFGDPHKALARAAQRTPDLVISDYRMPRMDGVEFTRCLRAFPKLADVPIVIVTVVEDRQIRYQALESGATDFLTRPIDPQEYRARCRNLLSLRRSQKLVAERAQCLEAQVRQATLEVRLREQETLLRLAKAGEYRDQCTGNHILRMAKYARLIAEHLGLSSQETDEIELSAPMHDLGKIGVPDHILLKPGAYTPEEMAIMRRHCLIGYEILANSPSRYLQIGAVIALGHHEKFDGTGYPNALAGDKIPLVSRIVAVADVFDALTSTRPYKSAWNAREAVRYIREQAGRHFDPVCVQAFLARLDDVERIMEQYTDTPGQVL